MVTVPALLDHGFFVCADALMRSGDALNWEILIQGEAERLGVLARSRKWPETELARESNGVGGIEMEGPYDPACETNEVVRRRSPRIAVGAGIHPKRATTTAVSEGTAG